MREDGVGPARPGAPRRPGEGARPEAVTLHPADLSVALRTAVSGIGAAGPPPGGLARVRRKARLRQRRRAMVAGSAGVLMIVMGVTVATGGRFSIVPALTGVVGLGPGDSGGRQPGGQSGQRPSAAGESSQPVWLSSGGPSSPPKTGPAIGPGVPTSAAPSAPAGTAQAPLCSATALNISTTLGATAGDIRYGEIDVVSQNSCTMADPPELEVTNQAGNAAASVRIMPADLAAAPGLPNVPASSGDTSVLQPGKSYEFQFAWVAPACPQPTGQPTPSASPTPGPAVTTYSLAYAAPGTAQVPGVTLQAACDAQVYVTEVYPHGAYPTPTPSPAPPTPTAPGSPTAGPPTGPAAPTTSVSPEVSVQPTDSPSAPQNAGKESAVPVSGAASGRTK